jgi:hypothetical protein
MRAAANDAMTEVQRDAAIRERDAALADAEAARLLWRLSDNTVATVQDAIEKATKDKP